MKPIRRPSGVPRVASMRPNDVPTELLDTPVVRALLDGDPRTQAVMDEAREIDRVGPPAGFGVVDCLASTTFHHQRRLDFPIGLVVVVERSCRRYESAAELLSRGRGEAR